MSNPAPVFVLLGYDGPSDASSFDESLINARVSGGRTAWVLQTWVRLNQAGFPARISPNLPRSGLAVLHADDFAACDNSVFPPALWTAVCRADRPPVWRADFEVVQNPTQADGQRTFYCHHWPQPALVPRDPARGDCIQNIGYFGMLKQLHPTLRLQGWAESLREIGLNWFTPGSSSLSIPLDRTLLHDYRDIDVVVALRDPLRCQADHKPPAKLINAWHAGVPAILSPESAYMALRKDELDFLVAPDPSSALAALQRLMREPELYAAMRKRAAERATAFTPAILVQQWRRLFEATLPAQQAKPAHRVMHFVRAFAIHGQRVHARLHRRQNLSFDLP
jgi:hypothetical protein